jgi:hypothetical protein
MLTFCLRIFQKRVISFHVKNDDYVYFKNKFADECQSQNILFIDT